MHLQVPPQNTQLLWQLNSHKHISSIPEMLRCCTIIVVTLNLMYVQVFKLRRKSHSLLDDPRTLQPVLKNSFASYKETQDINKSRENMLCERLFFVVVFCFCFCFMNDCRLNTCIHFILEAQMQCVYNVLHGKRLPCK